MSGSFSRKSSALRALRSQTVTHIADPTTIRAILRHRPTAASSTQSRGFYGFPQFLRRLRDCNNEVSRPSLFTSPFSSSSSSSSSSVAAAATEAFSKVGFVSWYLGMVKSRPILTKSITSSVIYAAADLSSQVLIIKPTETITLPASESYDLMRTLRMAGYGAVILGPSLHFWFNFVSKVLPKKDLITTFKKMLMGQTLYGPAMTAVFFSLNAFLQGENSTEIVARLKRDLLPTMISGVMYWPVCDFITFRFIPVHLQPLVSNSFSYTWTIYLTYMASLEGVDTTG